MPYNLTNTRRVSQQKWQQLRLDKPRVRTRMVQVQHSPKEPQRDNTHRERSLVSNLVLLDMGLEVSQAMGAWTAVYQPYARCPADATLDPC